MRRRDLLAALAAAAALAPPAAVAAAQRRSAPVAVDWTRTMVRTAEGGVRVGNPNAPVKVIEYLSLTCPLCAEFEAEAGGPLMQRYVRSGRISVEYRNYDLNGLDIVANLLSRCSGPRTYVGMSRALLGSQAQWAGRLRSVPAAQRAEIGNLPPLQVAQRLIPLLGLDAVGERFGITPAMRRQCLTQANLDRIRQLHNEAVALGVSHTPTFFINGRMAHTHNWAGIEPLLNGS